MLLKNLLISCVIQLHEKNEIEADRCQELSVDTQAETALLLLL